MGNDPVMQGRQGKEQISVFRDFFAALIMWAKALRWEAGGPTAAANPYISSCGTGWNPCSFAVG